MNSSGSNSERHNESLNPLPFPEDAATALDRVTDGFFALNHDWEFTYLNSGAADTFDRPASELVGENIWEAFPDATELEFKAQYETAIETQSPVYFEEYYPTLDSWFEVRAYPSEMGLSVYFREVTTKKQYKARLSTIHETTRQLMRAETPEEIASIVVESARRVLDFPEVALYCWNDEAGVLEPAAATDPLVERYDGELPTLSGNNSVLWNAFVEGETRSYETRSQPPADEMYNPDSPMQQQVLVPLESHAVIFAGTDTTDETAENSAELLELLATNATAALERAKREQSLVKKDEQLRRTNEQLTELNRINSILREIDQALIQATRRSEVETAVCERLADIDDYQLAWFGKFASQNEEITVGASAGDSTAYLDQLLSSEGDGQSPIPAERAIRTGTLVFTPNILDGTSEEPWRKEALNRGYRSIATLPIQFHGATYGVLEVYADHPNAFSEEERTVLRELSEVIGNAFNGIERKEALLADTYVELRFRISSVENVISRIATNINCEFTVESIVPRSDDTWLVYLVATNAEADAVEETAGRCVTVDSVEHIRSTSEGNLFGLVLTEFSGVDFLAEKGATITSMEANSTETDISVKVPQSVNVRSFVQTCKARYSGIELVGRKQVSERDAETPNEGLAEALTTQQRKALEAALGGGFFAWPRDKTGEEIADSLGVTPPTFHRHLRLALEKVVSRALD